MTDNSDFTARYMAAGQRRPAPACRAGTEDSLTDEVRLPDPDIADPGPASAPACGTDPNWADKTTTFEPVRDMPPPSPPAMKNTAHSSHPKMTPRRAATTRCSQTAARRLQPVRASVYGGRRAAPAGPPPAAGPPLTAPVAASPAPHLPPRRHFEQRGPAPERAGLRRQSHPPSGGRRARTPGGSATPIAAGPAGGGVQNGGASQPTWAGVKRCTRPAGLWSTSAPASTSRSFVTGRR